VVSRLRTLKRLIAFLQQSTELGIRLFYRFKNIQILSSSSSFRSPEPQRFRRLPQMNLTGSRFCNGVTLTT